MIKRGKAEKWAARGQRLSAALRENLKRRKAQARGRSVQPPTENLESMAGDKITVSGAGPDFRRNRGWKSVDGSERQARRRWDPGGHS